MKDVTLLIDGVLLAWEQTSCGKVESGVQNRLITVPVQQTVGRTKANTQLSDETGELAHAAARPGGLTRPDGRRHYTATDVTTIVAIMIHSQAELPRHF
jgi:hypothetical protein